MTTMHIGDIKVLAHSAHVDAAVREGLFHTMFAAGGHEARHAAWALTHLPASDTSCIDGHRDALVQLAIGTADVSLRRLSLALMERIEWGVDDVRADLLDFCMERMMLADEPYGVRSLCMKLAFRLCRHWPELKEELRQALLLVEPSEIGAGVRCTRKKILSQL